MLVQCWFCAPAIFLLTILIGPIMFNVLLAVCRRRDSEQSDAIVNSRYITVVYNEDKVLIAIVGW